MIKFTSNPGRGSRTYRAILRRRFHASDAFTHTGRRVCGPDGRTLFYSGFIEDTIERKMAVEDLKKHQEPLEEMIRERTTELVVAKEQAEAARRIREAEGARRTDGGQGVHTPIIALTAGVMENMDSSPLAGVFDDWVYKPFREKEIFDKLEKHLGVRFVYQPAASPAALVDAPEDRAALTPADLSKLPADWLEQFSRMLETGRSKQLLGLIDQLHPAHGKVARIPGGLLRTHGFERLISQFEEALKEKANG